MAFGGSRHPVDIPVGGCGNRVFKKGIAIRTEKEVQDPQMRPGGGEKPFSSRSISSK